MKLHRLLKFFVVYCFVLLGSISIVTGAPKQDQKIESLLNQAEILYKTSPLKGINLAQQAYAYALKEKASLMQMRCLNIITVFYLQTRDFKNAHITAQRGLLSAQHFGVDSLIGDFWDLSGSVYHYENKYALAIEHYKKALTYYKGKKQGIMPANVYLNLGICEKKLSEFEQASRYYFQAVNIYQLLKDTSDLSDAYNSIGTCFLSLSSYQKSLAYHHKALQLRIALHNSTLAAQSYNNIGFVFKEMQNADSAIFYLTKCLAIRNHQPDSSVKVLTLQNLGASWKMKGNLLKAKSFIARSLNIAAHYNMNEETARGNLDLAELYLMEQKYNEALKAVNVTEKYLSALNMPELLMNVYRCKYAIYLQSGNYQKALVYEAQINKLKDSLFSVAKFKAINEIEIKFEIHQKEINIASLNLQNRLQQKIVKQQQLIITMLTVGAILLLVLFVIAYRNFRLKSKMAKKIQVLMKELHHRVTNNLQILSALFNMQINEMSDGSARNALRENETRLVSMNLIHNKLYLNNASTKIEMSDYLTKLLNHIKASFGRDKADNVDLKIDVDDIMIEADKAVAIGLLLTEIATNAFKYAFDNRPGEINLQFKQQSKSKVLLMLSDNGIGIKNENNDSPSFGLKLIHLLATQLGTKLIVKTNNGTSYQMEIDI